MDELRRGCKKIIIKIEEMKKTSTRFVLSTKYEITRDLPLLLTPRSIKYAECNFLESFNNSLLFFIFASARSSLRGQKAFERASYLLIFFPLETPQRVRLEKTRKTKQQKYKGNIKRKNESFYGTTEGQRRKKKREKS